MDLEFIEEGDDRKTFLFFLREYLKNSSNNKFSYIWKSGSEGIKELILYKRDVFEYILENKLGNVLLDDLIRIRPIAGDYLIKKELLKSMFKYSETKRKLVNLNHKEIKMDLKDIYTLINNNLHFFKENSL